MASLIYRFGAMNSGKSTALLQVAHNYEERGMKVILIKPSVDTKGDTSVVSRLGVKREVDITLPSSISIFTYLGPFDTDMETINKDKPDAIIVDEAQFLDPGQVDELFYLTKVFNIPVLCYGLRTDFQMRGFPGATRLLELADDIEELKTICRCGKKATLNMRLINDQPIFGGDQVVIDNGENNISYESVCGKCYIKKRSLSKKGC